MVIMWTFSLFSIHTTSVNASCQNQNHLFDSATSECYSKRQKNIEKESSIKDKILKRNLIFYPVLCLHVVVSIPGTLYSAMCQIVIGNFITFYNKTHRSRS